MTKLKSPKPHRQYPDLIYSAIYGIFHGHSSVFRARFLELISFCAPYSMCITLLISDTTKQYLIQNPQYINRICTQIHVYKCVCVLFHFNFISFPFMRWDLNQISKNRFIFTIHKFTHFHGDFVFDKSDI